MQQTTDTLIGKECRFAWHVPKNKVNPTDTHIVKEQLTYKRDDGSTYQVPNLKIIENFKRPYWVHKQSYRNYKQKREHANLDELYVKTCTQSDLKLSVSQTLNTRSNYIRELFNNPYIYGADISSTSLIKDGYRRKYPDVISRYTMSVLDIETEMNDKEHIDEPICCSVLFKDKALLTIDRRICHDIPDVEEQTIRACDRLIGDELKVYNMSVEVVVCDNPGEMLALCIRRLHEWMPDWLAIWNVNFDVPKINACLIKHGYDLADVWCDPSIPKELRICEYVPGPTKQVTASGKVKPINPAAQWHTFHLTASFYVIDAMCAFKHIRLGEQEETSYRLDHILSLKLGIRKLKFTQAEKFEGLSTWHNFMQQFYRIEYFVYNIFDCLSMLLLDDKIKDLGYVLPSMSGVTDFWNFKSLPRKILDSLHFFALGRKKVMGVMGMSENKAPLGKEVDTTGDYLGHEIEEDEFDEDDGVEEDPQNYKVLGCENWIVTLPAHTTLLGLCLIEEDPELQTLLRAFVYDSDSVSSYPTCVSVGNVSKSTTKRELILIRGIEEALFRMQNLNVVIGRVNAVEYSCAMFNMPKPPQLLSGFKKHLAEQKEKEYA